ncbi:hypothetical protein [Pseudarthrobacter sp. Y6]|uniref:hypothetical protein n=1 Tax=Pseudarthrobacter sp. Y6 TaxID=3418422 RepID=UPI003CE72BE6
MSVTCCCDGIDDERLGEAVSQGQQGELVCRGASSSRLNAVQGYASVFLWAAGVAILIAPLALLLITITRKTFSGSDENQPVHLG